MSLLRLSLVASYVAIGLFIGPRRVNAEKPIDFVRDVQPILSSNCLACHGGEKNEGGLRLDRKSGMAGGDSGDAAIIPGNPGESAILARVRGDDEIMPPEDEGEPLNDAQINTLQRWIEQGANWPDHAQAEETAAKHWSLIKPVRHDLPETKNKHWSRNSIDPFVLARLEQEGLGPSPEADRYTLIRRVYLDIIGIPPTIEEVDAFVRDDRSSAYEELVDRLSDSEQYGERWARMWLDLARYADTQGYEKDNRRTIYRYRDWVIGAFNRNMSFKDFTIEQIAGDLLEAPTTEQLIATAFHRNTMTNTEGGTDDEEFRNAALVDRVNTTGQVWLGLTFACGQCHSHKYDPLTQREYYEFYAFLNQTEDNDQPNETPTLESPLGETIGKIDTLMIQAARQRKLLHTVRSTELAAGEAAWAKELAENGPKEPPKFADWHMIGPFPAKSFNEAHDQRFAPEKEIDFKKSYLEGKLRWESKPEYTDGKVHELKDENSAFYLYRTIETSTPGPIDLSFGSDDSIKVWMNDRLVLDNRVGRSAQPDQDSVKAELREGENGLLLKIVNATGKGGFYFRSVGAALPQDIFAVAKTPADERTPKARSALSSYYRTIAPELKPIRDRLFEIESQIRVLRIAGGGPTTPIMRELPEYKRRKTHVLLRGSFLSKGPEVQPSVPSALHRMPEGAPKNRLGLALWLVDENNPLTARVVVNRFWEKMFGRGLVASSEDFGTQGTPPSHPDLLDRLAIEFMEQGWSMKALVKQIAMSATYRQSSHVTKEMLEKDEKNLLFTRGPLFRIEAEMIRDQALAAGGLLSNKMYGPSVMPPQPPGVWQVVYSGDQWKTSSGEDRYRRGLYTFWRRTSPYPSMIAFDATSREVCSVRRTRTNTPLAALVTMNDPVYIEAAQALARMTVRKGGSTTRQRMIYAFRRCLIRPPRAAELERIVALYESELNHYRQHPDAAKLMATDGLGAVDDDLKIDELAAWTVVANVLLNLDETLTKG